MTTSHTFKSSHKITRPARPMPNFSSTLSRLYVCLALGFRASRQCQTQSRKMMAISSRPGQEIVFSSASCVPYNTLLRQALTEIQAPDATGEFKINPSRPLTAYLYPGVGSNSLLDRDVFHIALTEMFRAVFRKKNLRRTPGPQGELKRISTSDGSLGMYLSEDWSSISPLPTSMRVSWDE